MQTIQTFTRGRLMTRPFVVGAINTGIPALQILPDDANRTYLLIQNNSTSNLLVSLDYAPQAETLSLILGAGNFWEPAVVPVNSIYVFSDVLVAAHGVAIYGTFSG